jgi:1-acyl-sn-glycerol-3-phosphate acyltransferase
LPLLGASAQTHSVAPVKSDSPKNPSRAGKGIRAAGRLMLFCGTLVWVAVDYLVRVWLAGRRHDIRARCEWMSRSARALMKCVNLRAEYQGQPPHVGLLVSNHLSYLDILVFGARQPAVFVSKADVRNWPALGYLAKLAGTLFVRRERRADVSPLNTQMTALLKAGLLVVVFPEGTSSDGQQVLPFFSSLLEPAVESACAVTPAFIRYEVADGVAADEVCYWRDMTFGPHFLNLLTKREIRATVCFGVGRAAGNDRKQLSRELHEAVRTLGEV